MDTGELDRQRATCVDRTRHRYAPPCSATYPPPQNGLDALARSIAFDSSGPSVRILMSPP
jgi:hypothetical protein